MKVNLKPRNTEEDFKCGDFFIEKRDNMVFVLSRVSYDSCNEKDLFNLVDCEGDAWFTEACEWKEIKQLLTQTSDGKLLFRKIKGTLTFDED